MPGTSDIYLKNAENALGVKFPSFYREYMLSVNGGEINSPSELWKIYSLSESLEPQSEEGNFIHLLETNILFLSSLDSFPKNCISIGESCYGDQLVFLKGVPAEKNSIYFWDHETGEISFMANSFADLAAL